jgi:magnesium transporter
MRILHTGDDGTANLVTTLPELVEEHGWVWIDVAAGPEDVDELSPFLAGLDLDALAVRDAVLELDLSKVDDFGHHLLVILHGLRQDRFETYEIDCFVTKRHLVTIRRQESAALEVLWSHALSNPQRAGGGPDEMLARIADVLTRRLLSVVDAFEVRIDELIGAALAAHPSFLEELTAVRVDLAAVRRVAQPQREALDVLRRSESPLLSDAGRRRFSDAFDVAVRAAHDLDAARTALSETLDAYRGAEAREATDVTKILTVYAAIMLPLSLVAGFFGMNFPNLPGLRSESGWVVVTGIMLFIALLSIGVFVTVGWIRRPSGRAAGAALGRGLIEAARAPVQVGGAIYEVSTMPLRTITGRQGSRQEPQDPDG